MVKQDREKYAIPLVLLLLAGLIWLGLMHPFRLDDSFITYQYAHNAASGSGLVYNPDDVTLSTTAPLYALLLAAGSFLVSDFHVLGGLIGTLCIGLGGGVIYTLLPQRLGIWRGLAGLLYVLSTPLWLSLGMETALWIFLVLAAVALADRQYWSWAGLLAGIAVLVRPDAALLGVLLGIVALSTSITRRNTGQQWWRPVGAFALAGAIPVAVFGVWGMVTYGSPLPVTLGAKSAQAFLGITGLGANVGTLEGLRLIVVSLLDQSPLYGLFAVLLVIGVFNRPHWPTVLIALWGLLHLLTYAVLGIAPYRWYYAPLLPGVILLLAYGLGAIAEFLRQHSRQLPRRLVLAGLTIGLIAAPLMSFTQIYAYFQTGGPVRVMLPIVDWQVYQDVGEWLDRETPLDATVGVAEVGQVGFYANRWMTDYLGLLQPDVAEMLRRGDLYSWLAKYAPDYLVFQRFRGAPLVLYNYLLGDDPWFQASYREVTELDDPRYAAGPVTIFERVTPVQALTEQAVQVDYEGLRLVGYATDAAAITQPGQAIRVRLDWQVTGDLPPQVHLAVKALDLPVFPSFDIDYLTANWQGAFSTWHTLVWPDELEERDYPLHVAVGPTGGPYNGQNVGWFSVKP